MTEAEYIAVADLARLHLLAALLSTLSAGVNPSIPLQDVTTVARVVDGWTANLQVRIGKMRHGD